MSGRAAPAAARTMAVDRSQVYVELTKPRITLMVLLTVAAGFHLAGATGVVGWGMVHALIGAGLSCSGCGALNQYWERRTDGLMDRTRFRPLPSHKVSPLTAVLFGALLATAGVAWLAATVGALPAAVNAVTVATYLFVYTPLKRHSSVATLVGAVPGALPPVIGWTAATGRLDAGAAVLFAILFLWQIPHFLAIGRMYRDDYASAGMPMLSVVDPDGHIDGRQMVLYAAALLPVSWLLVPLGLAGFVYFVMASLADVVYLAAALTAAHDPGRRSARSLLLASVVYLPALSAAVVLDGLLG